MDNEKLSMKVKSNTRYLRGKTLKSLTLKLVIIVIGMQRRCLEAWRINMNLHTLNRDDDSYLPQKCLHLRMCWQMTSSLECCRVFAGRWKDGLYILIHFSNEPEAA